MGVNTKDVNGAIVWYESSYPDRWLDALGEDVAKVLNDFAFMALTNADAPAGWTTTLVEAGAGESTVALGTAGKGKLIITTDANENDGAQMQVVGEAFDLSGTAPLYFGIKFQVDEATQADFLVGLCITDTTLLGGMSDGIYFRKVDGSTDVNLVYEKDSAESTVVVDTCAADTDATYEFYFDGTNLKAYVDGVLTVNTLIAAETNFPDNEILTPSIAFLTGAASAQIMTVDWLRVIQCN